MRLTALLAAMLLVACNAGTPAASPTPVPVEKVTFMAGFKPQANLPFVAVYVAQERGYFREQALEVEIRHSAGSGEHIQLLATGRIQFSTGSAGDVMKRVADAGVPLVGVAQIGQRDEQSFAVRADSPIRTPKDWEGRIVGYKSTVSADYLALLKIGGVDRSKVREVAVGFDPRVLADGRVDVYPVFTSNEPDTLSRLGIPVRLIDPTSYGVPGLGLGFITNRETAEGKPDVVRRFLRASLRGLADAVADRDAAIDIVMKYAPGEDRAHQRYMLDTEIEAARDDPARTSGIGAMDRGRYVALRDFLLQYGALSKTVDVEAIFTDRFVKELYRDGVLVWR
ncbi:MAG TPA: ABC transporter substrate-binding protein [Candidatus Limnocylindria bacterium]|jgi:ABC-type nitrate/sulfonate/bicarbonate transport system substrate-binding protein|nr:ABC transporter substrate-binding protein [Candidatus Limnocylindria bacterium]